MRVMSRILAGLVALAGLVGCSDNSCVLGCPSSFIGAEVVTDADITKSKDGAKLADAKKGEEKMIVCRQDGYSVIILPSGTTGKFWSNEDDFPLGFVPADALKPDEDDVPACSTAEGGNIHGQDVHDAHAT